ncbi:hypothetical protein TNCV_3560731 [Trichonephila clavipes]|nr:hypothetical protein TNCV_3560731 [Trichonephila clavipes]
MVQILLTFKQRKCILKWYWEFKNISEVKQYGTEPPTRLSIACLRDKFEIDGTTKDIHKKLSIRETIRSVPLINKRSVLWQYTMNDDDPDRRTQLYKWCLAFVVNDANFVSQDVWLMRHG